MTPRVVRTVEDRFSDVVNERVDRAQKAIVAKFESEGSAWMSDNSGDRLAWVAAEAIRGMLVRPATVFAPLSVTAEQVEAGAEAVCDAHPHSGGGSTVVWEDACEDIRMVGGE